MENIEKLKLGTYFKRKAGAKKVYIRGPYCRFSKAYECENFYDCLSDYINIKKGKQVFINFDF